MAKVFVGLSGGVDSAVSAAILKLQGHQVIGAYIKIWSPEYIECTWQQDRLDAKRAAVALGVPFLEVDLSREYRDLVVSDMIKQYQNGYTPNPDVHCNRTIKFGAFSQWAFGRGADMIATGHYARIANKGGEYRLLRGRDTLKDQSYFLHLLNQNDLSRALFPVGELEKSVVRKKALEFNLPNARRPDSQGLCFVGDVSMKDFLSRFIRISNGPILNTQGEKIGEHDGAALYTIGQRHGFVIARPASVGPYYVKKIDTQKNTLWVTTDLSELARDQTHLDNMHWIRRPVSFPFIAEGVVRYRAKPVSLQMHSVSRVSFASPQLCSPGQSLVVYQDEECWGGGVMSV